MRAGPIVGVLLLLCSCVLAPPSVQAQANSCGSLQRPFEPSPKATGWTTPGGEPLVIRLQFRSDRACSLQRTQVPCTGQVVFSVLGVPSGMDVRFSPNPANVDPQGGAEATMRASVNESVERHTRFDITLRAQCGGVTAERKEVVHVDEPYTASVRVASSGMNQTAIRWGLEIVGRGSGCCYTTLVFEPRPQLIEGQSVRWSVPDSLDVSNNATSGSAVPHRAYVNLTAWTDQSGANFSVRMQPSFNFDPLTLGAPIELELPVTRFIGDTTPGPGPMILLLALASIALARRR